MAQTVEIKDPRIRKSVRAYQYILENLGYSEPTARFYSQSVAKYLCGEVHPLNEEGINAQFEIRKRQPGLDKKDLKRIYKEKSAVTKYVEICRQVKNGTLETPTKQKRRSKLATCHDDCFHCPYPDCIRY